MDIDPVARTHAPSAQQLPLEPPDTKTTDSFIGILLRLYTRVEAKEGQKMDFGMDQSGKEGMEDLD